MNLGHFTESEQEMAPILYGDPCSYCDGRAEHIDHIVPKFSGGDRTWENLTGACGRCNSSKSTRSLLFFLLGVYVIPRLAPVGARVTLPEGSLPLAPLDPEDDPDNWTLAIEDVIEAIYAEFPGEEHVQRRKDLTLRMVELAIEEQELVAA
jgi:hypothetical protein